MSKEKGILCPKCGSDNTKVKDKRNRAGRVKRRRICLDCGFIKIYTEERRLGLND